MHFGGYLREHEVVDGLGVFNGSVHFGDGGNCTTSVSG